MNRLALKSPQQSGGGGMMNLPGKGGVSFHKSQQEHLWTW